MSKKVLSDLDFANTAKATNLPDPVALQDATTKAYVDAQTAAAYARAKLIASYRG